MPTRKQRAEEDADRPIMHTGTDTPEGQRDLAVGEQVARDAGQTPYAGPVGPGVAAENNDLRQRVARLEAELTDRGIDVPDTTGTTTNEGGQS